MGSCPGARRGRRLRAAALGALKKTRAPAPQNLLLSSRRLTREQFKVYRTLAQIAMPILKKAKYEKFALAYAQTGKAAESYTSVYGDSGGAYQSAARLLRNAQISSRVKELLGEVAERTIKLEISHREARIAALQDRWYRMRQVIDSRAADLEIRKGPGGSTGLLVHRQRAVGSGAKLKFVHEYEVDTGLLRELREVERQAAIELGQWQEPGSTPDPNNPDGKPGDTPNVSFVKLLERFNQLPPNSAITSTVTSVTVGPK